MRENLHPSSTQRTADSALRISGTPDPHHDAPCTSKTRLSVPMDNPVPASHCRACRASPDDAAPVHCIESSQALRISTPRIVFVQASQASCISTHLSQHLEPHKFCAFPHSDQTLTQDFCQASLFSASASQHLGSSLVGLAHLRVDQRTFKIWQPFAWTTPHWYPAAHAPPADMLTT